MSSGNQEEMSRAMGISDDRRGAIPDIVCASDAIDVAGKMTTMSDVVAREHRRSFFHAQPTLGALFKDLPDVQLLGREDKKDKSGDITDKTLFSLQKESVYALLVILNRIGLPQDICRLLGIALFSDMKAHGAVVYSMLPCTPFSDTVDFAKMFACYDNGKILARQCSFGKGVLLFSQKKQGPIIEIPGIIASRFDFFVWMEGKHDAEIRVTTEVPGAMLCRLRSVPGVKVYRVFEEVWGQVFTVFCLNIDNAAFQDRSLFWATVFWDGGWITRPFVITDPWNILQNPHRVTQVSSDIARSVNGNVDVKGYRPIPRSWIVRNLLGLGVTLLDSSYDDLFNVHVGEMSTVYYGDDVITIRKPMDYKGCKSWMGSRPGSMVFSYERFKGFKSECVVKSFKGKRRWRIKT
jgi:hypothetical protein